MFMADIAEDGSIDLSPLGPFVIYLMPVVCRKKDSTLMCVFLIEIHMLQKKVLLLLALATLSFLQKEEVFDVGLAF